MNVQVHYTRVQYTRVQYSTVRFEYNWSASIIVTSLCGFLRGPLEPQVSMKPSRPAGHRLESRARSQDK